MPTSPPILIDTSQLPPAVDARFAIDCRLDYELDGSCDFVFMIHVADGPDQRRIDEHLEVLPATSTRLHIDTAGNRVMRLQANAGQLALFYRATVERTVATPDLLAQEAAIHDLPDDVLPHLLPTRYCESDLLSLDAQQLFGAIPPGYARVQAISDWIGANVEYRIGRRRVDHCHRAIDGIRHRTSRDNQVVRRGITDPEPQHHRGLFTAHYGC